MIRGNFSGVLFWPLTMASIRLGWSDPRFTAWVSEGEAGLGWWAYQSSAVHPPPRAPQKRRRMSCNPLARISNRSIEHRLVFVYMLADGDAAPTIAVGPFGNERRAPLRSRGAGISRRDQVRSQLPWAMERLYSGELQGRGRLLAIGEPEVSRGGEG
jgi:hypothetical protein